VRWRSGEVITMPMVLGAALIVAGVLLTKLSPAEA
jgi:drug/metabolite transporter (DMT)-like permease